MQFERPSGSIATRGETANCGRVSFMRNSTDPAAAVACTWNTFFEIDAVDGSLRHGCPLLQLVLQHRKLGTLRCRQGRAASAASSENGNACSRHKFRSDKIRREKLIRHVLVAHRPEP